jgi:ribonuclease HI
MLGKDGQALAEIYGYLGIQTNNFAEYQGLLEALKFARKLKLDKIEVRSDSELLVRQILGRYRVKSPTLKPLHAQAMHLIADLKQFSIMHVPREMNREADRLANEAISTRKTAAYIPAD